jgi:hypothetical protein
MASVPVFSYPGANRLERRKEPWTNVGAAGEPKPLPTRFGLIDEASNGEGVLNRTRLFRRLRHGRRYDGPW